MTTIELPIAPPDDLRPCAPTAALPTVPGAVDPQAPAPAFHELLMSLGLADKEGSASNDASETAEATTGEHDAPPTERVEADPEPTEEVLLWLADRFAALQAAPPLPFHFDLEPLDTEEEGPRTLAFPPPAPEPRPLVREEVDGGAAPPLSKVPQGKATEPHLHRSSPRPLAPAFTGSVDAPAPTPSRSRELEPTEDIEWADGRAVLVQFGRRQADEPRAPRASAIDSAHSESLLDELRAQLAANEEPIAHAAHEDGEERPFETSPTERAANDTIPFDLLRRLAPPPSDDTSTPTRLDFTASFDDSRARRQTDAENAANRMTLDRRVEARTVTDDLGTVTVRAETSHGEVHLTVVADRAETVAMIEQHKHAITDDLRVNAMEVGALHVGIDGRGGQSAGEGGRQNRMSRAAKRSITPIAGTPRALGAEPFAGGGRRVRIVL